MASSNKKLHNTALHYSAKKLFFLSKQQHTNIVLTKCHHGILKKMFRKKGKAPSIETGSIAGKTTASEQSMQFMEMV